VSENNSVWRSYLVGHFEGASGKSKKGKASKTPPPEPEPEPEAPPGTPPPEPGSDMYEYVDQPIDPVSEPRVNHSTRSNYKITSGRIHLRATDNCELSQTTSEIIAKNVQ